MKKIIVTLIAGLALVSNTAFAAPEAADELNEILQGELSAVETYKQALRQIKSTELEKALRNHEDAVSSLRAHVKEAGGEPVKTSGVWGTWAQAVTGTAKAIGDETALKALREGEQHGVKEYQEMLDDKDVPEVAKNLIRDKLLPNQKMHIEQIDKMIADS